MFEGAGISRGAGSTQYDTLAQVGGTADPSTVFARFGLAFIGELAKTSAPVGRPFLRRL